MKRAITIALTCTVAVVLPAASATAEDGQGQGKSEVAKQCLAQKKADKAAFRALHGKRPMRECIRAADGITPEELTNAAQQCRTEREADAAAFQETWGTNTPNENSQGAKRNAFGKCVSAAVKEDEEELEAPEEPEEPEAPTPV
jgi:hypothetical protein